MKEKKESKMDSSNSVERTMIVPVTNRTEESFMFEVGMKLRLKNHEEQVQVRGDFLQTPPRNPFMFFAGEVKNQKEYDANQEAMASDRNYNDALKAWQNSPFKKGLDKTLTIDDPDQRQQQLKKLFDKHAQNFHGTADAIAAAERKYSYLIHENYDKTFTVLEIHESKMHTQLFGENRQVQPYDAVFCVLQVNETGEIITCLNSKSGFELSAGFTFVRLD